MGFQLLGAQDSDDDGSVHLGEVLASQTGARAPPGAPANAVPGAREFRGQLKQKMYLFNYLNVFIYIYIYMLT